MRKPLVGINMKNYINTRKETADWLESTIPLLENLSDVDTFIFPSMGTLETTATILAGKSFGFGPQNMAPEKSGPLTGEFSVESIIDLKANYVEIGHAERKNIFHEEASQIAKKIKLALDEQITPVVCIGEQVKATTTIDLKDALKKQIDALFQMIALSDWQNVVLAYEPEWAIGKASSADTNYIETAHQALRDIIRETGGNEKLVRIIYGGSVSKENAAEIVRQKNVDGLFVGRFGHKPQNFADIVTIVSEMKG
ncbi:triose-phosphate isomerase [Listeria seeligeri]|uniref:triose-phosphate isomerase n=1 Tax=Listeria seeligeri TaxID=1640 RepID=UPI0016283035|nr:triose-phosphate isomerase [Listeria seeligeri]MBC1421355.1 triosephosphate isomerase [Listeria seeligeri]MBC1424132.1 triosephosphate isomerase [Listeria seeligeri]MBC1585689.1 triosephosphate isomerase [Listeria seeligeri]MBC1751160.1 triosephosphate isomerase [Listeria seeligeri]MBC1753908.1 triosephosphate isomerase [Listeria seeligeri]